jgi:hypothetical protein
MQALLQSRVTISAGVGLESDLMSEYSTTSLENPHGEAGRDHGAVLWARCDKATKWLFSLQNHASRRGCRNIFCWDPGGQVASEKHINGAVASVNRPISPLKTGIRPFWYEFFGKSFSS